MSCIYTPVSCGTCTYEDGTAMHRSFGLLEEFRSIEIWIHTEGCVYSTTYLILCICILLWGNMYLWRFLGWCCNHDDSLQHLSLSSAKATFCSDTYIHHMYVLIYVCSAKKYIWKKVNKFLIEFVYIILAMQTFGIVLIVYWRNKPKLI